MKEYISCVYMNSMRREKREIMQKKNLRNNSSLKSIMRRTYVRVWKTLASRVG